MDALGLSGSSPALASWERLKAIGNGQVPACVVMAWDLLFNFSV